MKLTTLNALTFTLGLSLASFTAFAAGTIVPHTFSANTKAVAAEVNENFTALEDTIANNETAFSENKSAIEKTNADLQALESTVIDNESAIADLDTKMNQKMGLVASLGYQKTPTVRGVTISNVKINGGSIIAPVAPGSSVELAMDFNIVDPGCPGCIDEIQIGFSHEAPKGCVFIGIPGAAGVSGSGKITLTAPSEPGVYYVGMDRAQDFSCPGGWWNGAPKTFNRYIAVITVQ